METLWAALGGIAGGGLLVWTIFAWIIDKRDKNHDEEKRSFFRLLEVLQEKQEKETKTNRDKLDEFKNVIQKLRLELELLKQEDGHMKEKLNEYIKFTQEILKKHSAQLEKMGKVIKVGN